jgi:hypothetical protein
MRPDPSVSRAELLNQIEYEGQVLKTHLEGAARSRAAIIEMLANSQHRLTGETIADAAGVSTQTGYNWLNQADRLVKVRERLAAEHS